MAALRQVLIDTVFGGSLPTDVATIELDVVGPIASGLAGVARIDKYTTLIDSHNNYAYLYKPTALSVNKLMIVHQGHLGYGTGGVTEVINQYLKYGFDVLLVGMPGKNGNDGIPSHAYSNLSDLKYFWGPTIINLNTLVINGYADIAMQGISGGAWTTTCVAAIDTRIKKSFATSGSLPLDLRDSNDSQIDWEQTVVGQTWGYENLYWLAALEPERIAYVICNVYDACCFAKDGSNAAGYGSYKFYMQKYVIGIAKDILDNFNGGSLNFVEDATHTDHKISKVFNIQQTQLPVFDIDPGVEYSTTIQTPPGLDNRFALTGDWKFQNTGNSWQTGDNAAPNYDGKAIYTDTVDPGTYEIYLHWVHHANRAMNVPISIKDGNTVVWSGTFQQKAKPPAPDYVDLEGKKYQKIGVPIGVASGTLVVELSQVPHAENPASSWDYQYVIAGPCHIKEI